MVKTSDFIKAHPVCDWCKEPYDARLPLLKLGRLDVPASVDNRDYCTAIEDQGCNPWCAAYSAAAFAENVIWRRDGRIREIDPEPIYKWAKAHDGSPEDDGTTLDCALEALRSRKVFDPDICKVRMVGKGWTGTDEVDLKAAIHRFGCVLGGFNITREWYDLCKPGVHNVTGLKNNDSMGGHAVLVCGYNDGGVWIENSWGDGWGDRGFGFIEWGAFYSQWMYGVVLTHCLDGFK